MEKDLETSSEIKSKITSIEPEFKASQILSQAWDLIKGQKLRLWLAMSLYCFLYMVVYFLFNLIPQKLLKLGLSTSSVDKTSANFILIILSISGFLVYFWLSGLLSEGTKIIQIKYAQTKNFEIKDMFSCFSKALSILLLSLISLFLTIIGFLLLIFPGLYLLLCYNFAISLHFRKKLSIWDALETARIQVTKKWFSVLSVNLISFLLVILGVFTLGIAWIWIIPLAWIAHGVLYTKLFEPENDFKQGDQTLSS